VHRWAIAFLHRNRVHLRVDVRGVDAVFRHSCDEALSAGSALSRAGLTRAYLKQEIDWLIKGRGLADREAYLAAARNGRGTPLPRDLREAVWKLYERYQTGLAAQNLVDFNDILTRAYEVARDLDAPVFDAVIIDEAQDLTESAVRLLAALVDPAAPDCLLLVGDGQQSIYPGGFHLASVGIDVRGRSQVLTRNYRNTDAVYRLAAAVVDGRPFDDGDEQVETVRGEVELARSGPPPMSVAATDSDEHDLMLASAIQDTVAGGCGPGDVAVLLPSNSKVKHYVEQIDALGLPTQDLADYDGAPNQLVKVGTYQRAKGLEFKQVFLPRLDADGLKEARAKGEDDASYAERLDLLRRQLFVAMTRARDALWLGWVDTPSTLLPTRIAEPESAQQ
jgi:superfamily I DNA/RNA helicase